VNDGGAGACFVGPGGCIQEGEPCAGGSTCCSRICFNPGSGTTVCQAAGGCRLTGTACSTAQECCGGGTNPNNSVQCSGNRCDNGQACNPVGNICGAPVLPDGGKINASQDCCDGMKQVCKLDVSGIPRCFGGGSQQCPTGYTGQRSTDGGASCCINEGDLCQFSSQCCDGAKCVPGADGGVQCVLPTCAPVGNSCTSSADCCAPAACIGNVCRTGVNPDAGILPDGGIIEGNPDGGTITDAGMLCTATGATCTASSQCCSMNCVFGKCGASKVCVGSMGACTATSDCCTGLACLGNKCTTSSCSGSGQTCSSSQACCTGLNCVDNTTGGPCGATGACSCSPLIQ
jgi:hypothetical protein